MRTVKEVSKLTGISIRTLRYYDEIGLLKPTKISIDNLKLEHLHDYVEKYGSIEGLSEALKEELKDEEIEANLIKLYGGKDKAVQASLSATGSMEEVQKFQKETDETYKMFAAAMLNKDKGLKEAAIKRLAESNKEMWHIENARYFLLWFMDEIERNELLIEATDKQYGVGVALFIAKAIREHYGVSFIRK